MSYGDYSFIRLPTWEYMQRSHFTNGNVVMRYNIFLYFKKPATSRDREVAGSVLLPYSISFLF